jgi:hypothetical protein
VKLLGGAKVTQLHSEAVLSDEEVLSLQIAMRNILAVQVRKPVGCVPREGRCALTAEWVDRR